MHKTIAALVITVAVLAGCTPPLPASGPDEGPARTEEPAGPDASFAGALADSSDAIAAAHAAIALANRAAAAEALRAAGPDPRAREAAVLAVYERFYPIWRAYAAAREAYAGAVRMADARDEAARGRRLSALAALARADARLAAAVAEARAAAYQPDGAQ